MKHNKYIIVTGANGYLSSHFTKQLSKKYNLILWDIKFDKSFKKNLYEISYENNSKIFFHEVDITNQLKVRKITSNLLRKKLEIYGLINCASINPQPNKKYPDYYSNYDKFINMWNLELNISLKGCMICIYEISKLMKKSRKGSIINFSSDLGLISPNQNIYRNTKKNNNSIKPLVYSISKHGIIGMTKYFSTLLSEDKIRVNAICFGGVYNNKFENQFVKKLSSLIPLGRMCDLDEIIAPIEFLLEDKNSYMTGHSLVVDGGRTIW